MFADLEKAVAALADRDAGWVTRRDAAEMLGKAAAKAVKALHTHIDDADVDVRRSVKFALGTASAGLKNIEPVAEPRHYEFEELIRECNIPGQAEAIPRGRGFLVIYTLKNGRKQNVHIEPRANDDGKEVINVYTRCAKPREDSFRWALRVNMNLAQCALAIDKVGDEDMLVLTNTFLAGNVTPKEIHDAVREIAAYGDWVESKHTQKDEF